MAAWSSVLRGGGQGAQVRRRAGEEDWSGQRAHHDASEGGIRGTLSRQRRKLACTGRSGEIGEESRGLTHGADVRERGLMVGHVHYVGFGKRVTGWVNRLGPVRNENRISELGKGFPMLQNKK
jgi:hypothetical protein